MKTIKIYFAMLTGTILLLHAACNKGENDFLYQGNMLPVTIKGYNGSSEQLIVKIDTFKFKYELGGNSTINLSDAYTFLGGQSTANLTITEKNTGKLVLKKELKKDDGPTTINLLYMDGKVSDMPVIPDVESGKIKVIYMFKPTVTNYAEPVDIAVGKFWFTPKVFEEITRIKNVIPNKFSEPIVLSTFATAGQQYNGQNSAVLFRAVIYKAGTNQPYSIGVNYTWDLSLSGPTLPAATTASSKLYIVEENPSGTQMRFKTPLTLTR
ncbi:hypothetical protein [Pedobacter helvus]|uniref:DUF4843 domain-containing protein n=1 Tax=Pedobacter helvus TaxID=2563444 RepID=A0ABW9JMT0_9SPHI|nr:hypothetical protein [Pedobacter ureilyticus]